MGATGTTTVSFGAMPGSDRATAVITGQTGILSNSRVEAWIDATAAATADHSADEHGIEDANIEITCQSIVVGTGFTIVLQASGSSLQYGVWNVAWVWV